MVRANGVVLALTALAFTLVCAASSCNHGCRLSPWHSVFALHVDTLQSILAAILEVTLEATLGYTLELEATLEAILVAILVAGLVATLVAALQRNP